MPEIITKVLDRVNSPQDVKNLSIDEMNTLAQEMREVIIKKVNTTGGHMAPNLGFVEPTIALHKVFESPKDKFVFDVSHQCYSHKILTGRKEGFTNSEKYYSYSGYTNPAESEHDMFVVGHTSTAVSLATGLAKGRDLTGANGNVIAVVGDGSLSGGEAYEGLNNAAVLGSNIIVVVNDNEMSIAENAGGLYKNLELLRKTNGKAENNVFTALGFEYYYVENGNNLSDLIEVFEKVKNVNHPVVVHLHTLKGKGLKPAEENKETFHWIMPGILDEKAEDSQVVMPETYDQITTDFLLRKKAEGCPVLAITAATPGATGFTKEFREKMGSNYCDVGIAEEHAMAFASGIARNGGRPVISIVSSFIQRTYDQLSQDLALNNNPATILVNWGGLSSADMTHLGCFDIPLISNIPNLVYLAPAYKEEYLRMLDWSLTQKEHTVLIRVPFASPESCGVEDNTDYSILNKYKVEEQGKDVAIIALGHFLPLGKAVKNLLREKCGINATLINPCFVTGVDKELLDSLKKEHKVVVTIESGILEGGFGHKIASFYGNSGMKVLNFGGEKEFADLVPMEELMDRYHLTPELMVEDINKVL